MNILQVIKRFDFGGSENHVCDISNALAAKGHRVIVAGGKGRQCKKLVPDVKFMQINGTDFLLPLYIFRLISIIKKNSIDIIHAHQRLSILAASIAGYLTGTRVIATVHGRAKYDVPSILSRRIPHTIVFVSNKVLDSANQKYQIAGKSIVIPNGIGISNTKPNPTPYKICYVSRIDKAHFKTLIMLVNEVIPNLVRVYPKTQIDIIGDGGFRSDLEKAAHEINQKLGMSVCSVLGYSSNVNEHINNANIVLGVGRVALEALSSGVPVISINSKRFGGIIADEEYERTKLTNFIDTSALQPTSSKVYDKIVKVFMNPHHYYNQAISLKEKTANDFSMDSISHRILNLYQSA